MDQAVWYRWLGDDLEISVRVQPRAPRDAFFEPQGGYYRVRIQAPPVDGKANAALRRFLAEAFGVPQSQVEFLSGEQSQHKRLRIRAPRRLPLPMAAPPPESARPNKPAGGAS